MKIKSIKKIDPELSNCISVDAPNKLFAIGEESKILTHNSVSQQNIIISCLLRPEHWVILGIDLKKVELSRYKKFGVKVATELETAVEFLRFAQAVMMKRYTRMEELGVNDFEDLPEKTQALLVMIDEAGELLSPTGAKALSEKTLVQMADSSTKTLGEIKVGDVVLDNNSKATVVTDKYEPIVQKHYKMKISSDKTNESEEFISGEEHLWVVYFEGESLEGPFTMNTEELFALKGQNKKIKFKKVS